MIVLKILFLVAQIFSFKKKFSSSSRKSWGILAFINVKGQGLSSLGGSISGDVDSDMGHGDRKAAPHSYRPREAGDESALGGNRSPLFGQPGSDDPCLALR